ncbi:MAG: tetratricopeptide repeat protein [Magnetococcales bacterium]|nr:tetratricopeptide repeat protein [Magnetococcales bacterium]
MSGTISPPDPYPPTHTMSETSPTQELRAALAEVAGLIDQQRWHEAKTRLLALKQQHPGHPHVLHLLGVVRQELGDRLGALEALSQAVTAAPDQAGFQLDLGLLLKKKGARLPALERLQEAVRLDPDHANAHFHLGDLWMDQGEVEKAIPCFHKALALKPELVAAHINLGLCQKSQNQTAAALASFQEAIRLQPDHAQAHVNLAMAQLMLEHYPEGWQEYEWRFKLDQASLPFPPPPLPRWQGEPLSGKTLLLLGEQGFGDMIQFIRFVPSLAALGARVLVAVPTPLVTLFRPLPGLAVVQDHLNFSEPVHYYIPLLSLPLVLGTTPQTIPTPEGYLTPEAEPVALWRTRLAGEGRKVGLIWSGKPLHANDPLRRRSCTLRDLAPLARLPGIRLFGLQKEHPDQPIPEDPGFPIHSLAPHLTDFAATAAIMSQMDRIITIDTAAAHLAGALGRPVWTLLPRAPDWRWGQHLPTTPWYTTMRLFRQTVTNGWEEPIHAMVQAMEHDA